LANRGRLDEAIAHYRRALEINPQMVEAHVNLGNALQHQGDHSSAVRQWCAAIHLQPNVISISILNQTAWILATCGDATARNGAQAVELAERAAGLTARRDPAILDTLAAAYAETGRFAAAVQTAQQSLAIAQHNPTLAEKITNRIKLYQSNTACRDAR
jgi:tetratricopeptide (TPR) repeat protein